MKRFFFFLWNFWPPFLGAGIWIQKISSDFRFVSVRLKRRPWNKNLVGTQFGGSIYAMTDPFYMALLVVNLGPEYIVWDKASSIRFRKPGRTDLLVEFKITDADLAEIRSQLTEKPKLDWERDVHVMNLAGELVAEVRKTIHISKKPGR